MRTPKAENGFHKCNGTVQVYNFYVMYKLGRYYLYDSEFNQLNMVYTERNACRKLVGYILDEEGEFTTERYREIVEDVKKAIGGIESEV